MARCGFIGLGIMGEPMARNLLNAGNEIVVWNRTKSKADTLVAEGARLGLSPSDVAKQSDFIFICVTNSQDVLDVVHGTEESKGVIEGVKEGTIIVDHSTIAPDVSRQLSADLEKIGVSLYDIELLKY